MSWYNSQQKMPQNTSQRITTQNTLQRAMSRSNPQQPSPLVNAYQPASSTTAAKQPKSGATQSRKKTLVATQTSNAVATTLEEFTCFPGLPPELRCMIWSKVCQVSRIIDLYAVQNQNPQIRVGRHPFAVRAEGKSELNQLKSVTECKPPAVLHVCREAREAGLKHYSLEFGRPATVHGPQASPTVYVNWARDTLCPTLHSRFDVEHIDHDKYPICALKTLVLQPRLVRIALTMKQFCRLRPTVTSMSLEEIHLYPSPQPDEWQNFTTSSIQDLVGPWGRISIGRATDEAKKLRIKLVEPAEYKKLMLLLESKADQKDNAVVRTNNHPQSFAPSFSHRLTTVDYSPRLIVTIVGWRELLRDWESRVNRWNEELKTMAQNPQISKTGWKAPLIILKIMVICPKGLTANVEDLDDVQDADGIPSHWKYASCL